MEPPQETSDYPKTIEPLAQVNSELAAKKAVTRAKTSSERTRDHLANERTYLAWMRTAIALTGFGVLIARLRYLISPDVPGTGYGWALGLLFAGIGLLTVLLSTQHYFWVLSAIDADTYQPSKRWVILFSLVVMLLGTGVIYVLLTMPTNLKFSIF
ncbi:YidH family protein [Aerosakkonemataceae cyanobacterium BLCC-F50]|uniref:YidH family protein n=1 Tax=Floridaenema flaviceps BLCC-F50 TaxID=3153642 RepID=A0ABV4XTI0_9CYAN